MEKIKLPKKAENQCFFDAIAYHFLKTSSRKKIEKFKKDNLVIKVPTPVKVRDIKKFEKHNSHLKMSINILCMEEKDIFPVLISKSGGTNAITLLLYNCQKSDGNKIVRHYSYIEDINKFLRKNYRGNGGKLSYQRSSNCPNCLQKFGYKTVPKEHLEACQKNEPQKVIVPEEGETVQFKNFNRRFPCAFFGTFDFEACQKKPVYTCEACQSKTCTHATTVSKVQIPITCSLLIVDGRRNKIFHKFTYSGLDCASQLISRLLSLEGEINAILTKYKEDLELTAEEEMSFEEAEICHICETEMDNVKVRDHCHATGKYLGAAHASCNLNRQENSLKIPLFCHNLSGYDSHFLMQVFQNFPEIEKLEGLSFNSEKFRTITVNRYVLLDSLSFLSASLMELVEDLTKSPN